jgi:hypothetical protein
MFERRSVPWVSVAVAIVVLASLLFVAGSAVPPVGPGRSSSSTTDPLVPAAGPSGPLTITSFTVSPNPVTQGSSFSVNVQASGGAQPYNYAWNVFPPGCSAGNGPSWSCTLGNTGSFPINVTVSDSGGNHTSQQVSLTVTSSGGNGNGNNNGNGSNNNNNNNGSFNLSGLGNILAYALIGAIVSFALLIVLVVGVLITAVTVVRRLPKQPRGQWVCGACQAKAPAGSKFCPSCAAPLTPPK